jgi:hypothetical protein
MSLLDVSGVATIDATTHLRAQTNQPKKNIVTFCSKTKNKPFY